jgi:hypothetical protein
MISSMVASVSGKSKISLERAYPPCHHPSWTPFGDGTPKTAFDPLLVSLSRGETSSRLFKDGPPWICGNPRRPLLSITREVSQVLIVFHTLTGTTIRINSAAAASSVNSS